MPSQEDQPITATQEKNILTPSGGPVVIQFRFSAVGEYYKIWSCDRISGVRQTNPNFEKPDMGLCDKLRLAAESRVAVIDAKRIARPLKTHTALRPFRGFIQLKRCRLIVRVLLQGLSAIIPPIVVAQVFVIGLFPTLWHMLRHPRSIPFPNRWRDSFHHAAQPLLLAMSDSVFRDQKRQLIAQAKGRVLEVGAGTGCTLKYYDKDNVEMVYGVEPDLPVLNRLEKEVAKRDLIGKYKILPFGIDDTDKMTEAEITPGSIDTVVCVFSHHSNTS